jgi:hypothetical protein
MSWRNYLSTVSVPFAIPMTFGVVEEDGREIAFVELTVRDSTSDETITVKTRRPVQPLALLTNEEAADVVRDLVRIAVLHEIDEVISIDGERPFDPLPEAAVTFIRDLVISALGGILVALGTIALAAWLMGVL